MNYLLSENYNWRYFFLLIITTLAVFISFWNINVMFPALALTLSLVSTAMPAFRQQLPSFSFVDAILAVLLVSEVLNYNYSIYAPNSFVFLQKILFFTLLYSLLRLTFATNTAKNTVLIALSGYGFLLALGAFLTFILLQTQLQLEDWQDASQFKRLYSPFGLLNNEWATIALCLLPFPLIAAAFFSRFRIALVVCALAFAMVNASALVSFSRGAYLSLGVFWLITIMIIFYFKLLNTKALFKIIGVLLLLTVLFIIPIRTPFFTTLSMNKTVTQQRSTQGRMDILQSGLCLAKDHWWLGVGSNNYAIVNDQCSTPREDQGYSGFTNNTYLQLLIEKGILGLAAYGLFFLAIIINFSRNIIRATDQTTRLVNSLLLAGFLTFCFRELFFSSLLYSNGVLTLVSVFAAAASTSENSLKSHKKSKNWLLFGVILLLGTGWILHQKNDYKKVEQLVQQAITQWNKGDKSAALIHVEKAIQHAPNVAPYHALAGLIEGQTDASLSDFLKDRVQTDSISITKAIIHFTKALQLNPLDAGYHFNLGWLHFLQNRDSRMGLEYLNRALALEPNNSEFLIGKGIVLEYVKDTTAAFEAYAKAIRLDPEILDSKFYNDIMNRKPYNYKEIIEKTVDDFEENPSTIIAARLGKLLINTENIQEAKKILQRVVKELPDLNRPYYHLAIIAEREGDTTQAISLLRQSMYLDGMDYLPVLALGHIYYNRKSGPKNAAFTVIRYYQDALRYWLSSRSNHHGRANIKYKVNTPVNNDLIPKDLLHAAKAQIDFVAITTRIAEMYVKIGNKEDAAYYKMLSQKAFSAIKIEDIQ